MRRRRIGLNGFVSIAGAAIVLSLGLAGCGEEAPLPESLVGRFDGSGKRYAGRSITLTPETITLGFGEGESKQHEITSIRRAEKGSQTIVTVEFASAYGGDRIAFYEQEGAIILENQPDVLWIKGELNQ